VLASLPLGSEYTGDFSISRDAVIGGDGGESTVDTSTSIFLASFSTNFIKQLGERPGNKINREKVKIRDAQ
jgi:hypothetical protein